MIKEALENDRLKWKQIQLKRGELLSRAGEVEKYFYLIKEGALRAYTIVEDKEFILRFAYKDSIFTSLSSYFSGEKGDMYIEAIRASTVLQCNKVDLEEYLCESRERLMVYKKMLEDLIIGCIEREHDLMIKNPKERIERIMKRSPQIFQEIPHKYIAAYLRMSPETLSRMLKS